ncbi:MAG: xylulokinase [Desulfocapsaceae bacterium]
MDAILAVDIGTQSLKAGIVDDQLNILERQQVPLSIQVSNGLNAEMDGEEIWTAVVAACSRLNLRDRVQAVVFSTLCPSLVPLDGSGRPLHPVILHLDRRSDQEAQWALETIGQEAFLNISGNLPVPGGISLTSLLWLKKHAPEIYRRKDVCFGHVATLMLHRLTGKFLIDPSNASFTGLYDTVGYSDWDERIFGPLDIDPGKLPAVQYSNSIAGELLTSAASELGISSGLPVVTGANDTTCACVGADVTAQGDLLNTSGTVDILVLCLEKPLVSLRHLLRTHAYPGKWLAMRTVGAGGGSLEWFRQNFCRELKKEVFYSSYLKEVLEDRPALRASFLPFLSGNRHQVGQATASFNNLTLDSTREEMLLALLDGVVSFQFEELDVWKDHVSLSNTIKHVGGGAKNSYTAFKQGKLTGYELKILGETTLIGAARLAFETVEK